MCKSLIQKKGLIVFWEPHEYQKEAVKFLVTHGSGSLWLDPGLGKTAIVLSANRTLRLKGLVKKMLVLAPFYLFVVRPEKKLIGLTKTFFGTEKT